MASRFNNNRLLIEELPPQSPSPQRLPAISAAPLTPSSFNAILPLQQASLQALAPSRSQSVLNASLELNNTQQRVKQLESRLQVTEVSNRAVIEEMIRLQNELAVSLRRSFDSLQEERQARQTLENNYRFQTDSVLQLSGRLKRAEDTLNEDRVAMQSLIVYTKNLEQTMASAQKDIFVKRDYQMQRLEDLKLQIDDLSRSKENLERSAYSLLEEIKSLKGRVDMEAINLNSIGVDLRNKTRRLEDENRQQYDAIRRQQDSVTNTDNNMYTLRTHLEGKISEVRDITNDLRVRIESEKDERRNLENFLNLKFGEVTSSINDEKMKLNENMRTVENIKREFSQNMDMERARVNALVSEMRESVLSFSHDRLEKCKEDVYGKLRDIERHVAEETDERVKAFQYLKESTESKIDANKRQCDEDFTKVQQEHQDYLVKNSEQIRKLNEGLNLIEQQGDERCRQIEKVLGAEIKLRRHHEKEFNEKLDNYNEKFTYAIQSFQSSIGNMSSKINDLKEQFVHRRDFDAMEKKHENLQADQAQSQAQLGTVNETLKNHQQVHDKHEQRLKDLSETNYKLDNITIPAINTRMSQLATKDELNTLKKDYDHQLQEEVKNINKRNDDYHATSKQSTDQRLNDMNVQITSMNTQLTQKISSTEKHLKDQMTQQNDSQHKEMAAMKDDMNKSMRNLHDDHQKQKQSADEHFDSLRGDLHSSTDKTNQAIHHLDSNMNDKLNHHIDNTGTWKRNTTESIEKLKAQQEHDAKEFKNLETKISALKNDHKKLIDDEAKTRQHQIEKLQQELNNLERNAPQQHNANPNNNAIEAELNKINNKVAQNTELIHTSVDNESQNRKKDVDKIWNTLNSLNNPNNNTTGPTTTDDDNAAV